MRQPPQQRRLSDGRLHLHDGPIDLIIEAFGARDDVERAYAAAWLRFATVLDELCAELPLLRAPARANSARPNGRVARRMYDAVAPFAADVFITPMAAVAGSVAEEILEAMTRAAPLSRAYVNNGGDIALHLGAGESFRIGMIDRPDRASAFGRAEVDGDSPVRGVATSGRHGRSFSLGIADAVTVLAANASKADAAATLIANAVDLPGHPAIRRAPASAFDPQSDLGERLVTRDVGVLAPGEIDAALTLGLAEAERLKHAGHIVAAALHLQGETRVCGAPGTATVPVASFDASGWTPELQGKSGRDARVPKGVSPQMSRSLDCFASLAMTAGDRRMSATA
jgi:ApbE superfamily uncharacterized protein (UPF0280 family)